MMMSDKNVDKLKAWFAPFLVGIVVYFGVKQLDKVDDLEKNQINLKQAVLIMTTELNLSGKITDKGKNRIEKVLDVDEDLKIEDDDN